MIRGNDIDTIPNSISKLEKLKTLQIENCALNKIPDTLNKMKGLEILGLADTKLKDLSWNSFRCNLKEINFSGTGKYKKEDLEYLKMKITKSKIYP